MTGNLHDQENNSRIEEVRIGSEEGIRADVLSYGGIIHRLLVPDGGKDVDVILGYDDSMDYLKTPYCSAVTIGRCANRIRGAHFSVDGKEYRTEKNETGNTLHSGSGCYGTKNFSVIAATQNEVELGLFDNGQGGFPGTAEFRVIYRIIGKDTFEIEYRFVPAEDTPVSLTNHGYFNLSGGEETDVANHTLQLEACYYTPVDGESIPNGEVLSVKNTDFDFRSPQWLGERLDRMGGYDVNFPIDGRGYRLAAKLQYGDLIMQVLTDQRGIQIYTGNHFNGTVPGKRGLKYQRFAGICFEAQEFPDAIHMGHFPDPIARKDKTYIRHTRFVFQHAEERHEK